MKSFRTEHVMLASVLSLKNNVLCSLTPTSTNAHSQIIRIFSATSSCIQWAQAQAVRWTACRLQSCRNSKINSRNTHTEMECSIKRALGPLRIFGNGFHLSGVSGSPDHFSAVICAMFDPPRLIWQHPQINLAVTAGVPCSGSKVPPSLPQINSWIPHYHSWSGSGRTDKRQQQRVTRSPAILPIIQLPLFVYLAHHVTIQQ